MSRSVSSQKTPGKPPSSKPPVEGPTEALDAADEAGSPPEKRKRYSTQDVAIIALTYTRLDVAIEKLLQMRPSRIVLRDAVQFLRQMKKPTTLIDSYCEATGSPLFPKRGRKVPAPGMCRVYVAQVLPPRDGLPRGGPFIRLPLSVLGIKKSESVMVDFDKEQITVRRLPAEQA